MITFKEETHQYFNQAGVEYTPVSNVISKFKQPFYSEFWSLYKSIEAVLTPEEFSKYKLLLLQCNLNDIKLGKVVDTAFYNIRDKIYDKQKEILFSWDDIKLKACFKGTAFHKDKENEILKNKGVDTTHTFIPLGDNGDYLKTLKNGIYPELRVWSDEFLVCGTSDIVIIEDGFVDIDDYKTNKAINIKSYKDKRNVYQMMKSPIGHLYDCNYTHYSLQLSMYMYFLECLDYKPRSIKFTHHKLIEEIGEDGCSIFKSEDKPTIYNVKYLKEEVIAILKAYRNG